VSGLSGLSSAIVESQRQWERKPADFYPTPPDVTVALLNALGDRLPSGSSVLEPACGDGAMAKVLTTAGHRVTATDLRDDSGYGVGGCDFLDCEVGRYDAIFTNPPFNVAAEFISKAVPNARIVAMLLKSQYWHAARRQKLFNQHPPSDIYALTWRPSFLEAERGRSPLMDVIWTVWDENYLGPTRFQQIARPIPVASDFDDLLR